MSFANNIIIRDNDNNNVVNVIAQDPPPAHTTSVLPQKTTKFPVTCHAKRDDLGQRILLRIIENAIVKGWHKSFGQGKKTAFLNEQRIVLFDGNQGHFSE